MATAGSYQVFTGPAFFVQVFRGRGWECRDVARPYRDHKLIKEFTYGKEDENLDRRGLMSILVKYLHTESLAVYSTMRFGQEDRRVEVLRADMDVDSIVENLVADWGHGKGKATNFFHKFLTAFPRQSDPETRRQMKTFMSKTSLMPHATSKKRKATPAESGHSAPGTPP